MTPRQTVLDSALAIEEPIERLIGLALLHLAQVQNRAEAGKGRLRIHRTHKSKLRARRYQTVHHHGNYKIAMAPRCLILRRAQYQPIQCDLADRAKRRRDMPMRQRALNLQIVRASADHCPALQERLQRSNHIRRQPAEIGQGPFLRAALLVAIALP